VNYRRADWRFLLPSARQERVRDVTDQRLVRLLPHTPDPSSAACDLVLGSNPRGAHFERAFASLRPGGVCYLEWRSRLRPTAGSLRRRLEAVGFVGVRLYWSWPPDIPSAWVPLEAPAAVRWVLRSRHRAAIERAWRAAHAARLLRPRCATAVRPPLTEQVGPLGVSLAGLDGDPVWALVAPGGDPLNKVLAFVGVRGRQAPGLVLKMPRTAAAEASLEREAASLRVLESAGTVQEGVPRLLFVERDRGGLRAIAESPLEGRPLLQLLDRGRYPELIGRATEWLVALALATTRTAERMETTAEVAEKAAAGSPPGDRQLLLDTGCFASAADRLPVVFEQRDFSPWNVHIGRDGGLVVYDWESAEPAGFPALDLVYLLAYCGFFLDGALASGRTRESYRATFGDGIAEGCLRQYCQALGIDPDRLPALRALTWLVHARSTLRRDPSGASAALFLDLLREEIGTG
jgi:aminoglycoside phosphotransferase (APT) family kinase protein